MSSEAKEESRPTSDKEIPPRQALLDAIVSYNHEKVRAMFTLQVLDALRQAVGQDATEEEVRMGLITHDGSGPSLLMTACGIGNIEAVRPIFPPYLL